MTTSAREDGEAGGGKPEHVRRQRSRALHDLRQHAEYLLLRATALVVRCLPLVFAYWAVEIALLAAMRCGPLRRRMRDTREQLETAYGDEQDAAWREHLARESVRYFAWQMVDVLLAPHRIREPAWWACVDVSSAAEVLRRDGIGARSGAILVGAHHGAPDVGSLALAIAGWPHTAIVNRIANPRVLAYVEHQRRDVPREDIPQEGALRTCRRLMRRKGMVAIQIDTDAGRHGIFVRYFGTRASTSSGAATLALLTGTPIYMMASVRTRRRRAEYRVTLEGPLEVERTGEDDADVKALTAAATLAIEGLVRAHPEQMMWTHRRWKTRPFQSRDRKFQRERAAQRARRSGTDAS